MKTNTEAAQRTPDIFTGEVAIKTSRTLTVIQNQALKRRAVLMERMKPLRNEIRQLEAILLVGVEEEEPQPNPDPNRPQGPCSTSNQVVPS